jgi:hypothetical protein
MQEVREIQTDNREHIITGFMYSIYLMTLLCESIMMSISYLNTTIVIFVYLISTSMIVRAYNPTILLHYWATSSSFVGFCQIVIFAYERKTKTTFLQVKKIMSLLDEQNRIFDHMPDGLIMHQVKDIEDQQSPSTAKVGVGE